MVMFYVFINLRYRVIHQLESRNPHHAAPVPRAYPDEFGRNLRAAWEHHIGPGIGPGRRDLRFKPQYNRWLDEVEQFANLPLGDVWEEADLLPAVTYLMTSKKCRRGLVGIARFVLYMTYCDNYMHVVFFESQDSTRVAEHHD